VTDRIEGQVARVLSDRRLAINRGEEDGVREGMTFAILSRSGLDIKDPETGLPIGSVEVAKTVVKVVSVQPRVAIARTFRTVTSSGIFGALSTGPTKRSETLRTDGDTAEREIDESESRVKTGDAAVQVLGDEFEGLVLGF